MLGGLLGAAAQIAQLATAATQQAEQQDPNAQDAAGPDDGNPDDGDPGGGSPDDPPAGAAGGPESAVGRAPIHVSFDAGAAHTELTVDPETTKGSIHVSVDPANPTAPPRITTEV